MITIINTLDQLDLLFDDGQFNLDKWEIYINRIYENSANLFKDEVNNYISSGNYCWEKDFLPIINNVYKNRNLTLLSESFLQVVEKLNARVVDTFQQKLDVDVVLFLGLCNGAGWATEINGRNVVLLGIEKILELEWFKPQKMQGLIYHELGHVYHKQFGLLQQLNEQNAHFFVYQLFVEGVAMYFEQSLVGDFNYFHQDNNDWKKWCDENFVVILKDFHKDLPKMTRFNQRFFGDWANYKGKADVGYYLGARFVHHLIERYSFNEIITFDSEFVYKLYNDFVTKVIH